MDDPILSVSFAAIELEWARGSVATPYGPIHAAWRRNATGSIEITCHAPPECRRVEGPLADIHPDLACANE